MGTFLTPLYRKEPAKESRKCYDSVQYLWYPPCSLVGKAAAGGSVFLQVRLVSWKVRRMYHACYY
jgi:hypothetical protein